jgi:hypothetical protein
MSIKKWVTLALVLFVALLVVAWAWEIKAKAAARRLLQAQTENTQKQALQIDKASVRKLDEDENLRLKLVHLHFVISKSIFGQGSRKSVVFQRCNVEPAFSKANQNECAKLDVEAEGKFGGNRLQEFRQELREADDLIQQDKNALNHN